jgi:hypothetical protein
LSSEGYKKLVLFRRLKFFMEVFKNRSLVCPNKTINDERTLNVTNK